MSEIHYQHFDSPIGTLRLLARDGALVRIEFENGLRDDGIEQDDPVLAETAHQLQQYFAGERTDFDLPLRAEGTDFQRQVWNALSDIPFGELRSYRDIATSIGRDKAVRAVGAANGANPIPIVVPCHRVVGSDGTLTGFGGGLPAKKRLLAIEGITLTR